MPQIRRFGWWSIAGIIKALGGRRAFGAGSGRIALLAEIERGLPVSTYVALVKALGLAPAEDRLLQVSLRTRVRWKQRRRLDSSDGIRRLFVTIAVCRITKERYRHQVFAGRGGLYAYGRWTPRGRPVVYTSPSISLAVLEYALNYKRHGWLPASVLARATIPDEVNVESVSTSALPENWRDPDPPTALRDQRQITFLAIVCLCSLSDGTRLGYDETAFDRADPVGQQAGKVPPTYASSGAQTGKRRHEPKEAPLPCAGRP